MTNKRDILQLWDGSRWAQPIVKTDEGTVLDMGPLPARYDSKVQMVEPIELNMAPPSMHVLGLIGYSMQQLATNLGLTQVHGDRGCGPQRSMTRICQDVAQQSILAYGGETPGLGMMMRSSSQEEMLCDKMTQVRSWQGLKPAIADMLDSFHYRAGIKAIIIPISLGRYTDPRLINQLKDTFKIYSDPRILFAIAGNTGDLNEVTDLTVAGRL